jgi:hypothetical protein
MSDDAILNILHSLKYDLATAMDSKKPTEPAIEEAAQQIRQYIDKEIIGADEPKQRTAKTEVFSAHPEVNIEATYMYHQTNDILAIERNKMRATQRFKLREPME